MKSQKTEAILKGNMYRVIVLLALPIMVNNLIQTLYNLIDSVWVSRLGAVPLAAVSFVWPINFLFVSIGTGLGIATTSILSQEIGKSRVEEGNRYAAQLLMLASVGGFVFAAVGYYLSPMFVSLMGGVGELGIQSNLFLKISFLGMPFTFLFFIFNGILNAQGKMMVPTLLSGASAILNAILDPIFIFTLDLGVEGAAIATLIAQVLLAIAGMVYLWKGKTAIKIHRKHMRIDKARVRKILGIAIPSAVGQSGAAMGFMVLNGFIASYGTATLAAFGMVNKITSLVSQPAMGIGAALVTIVGQNLGAYQSTRAKEGVKKSFWMAVVIGMLGCILMVWQNEWIINFFMQTKDDPEVIQHGITYLNYIAISMPLMGIFSVLQGVFQGSGYTRYSMAMEIGRLWCIRLPLILIFKYFTPIGSEGIWFAMSFSNFLICVYGGWLYAKGKWDTGKPKKCQNCEG